MTPARTPSPVVGDFIRRDECERVHRNTDNVLERLSGVVEELTVAVVELKTVVGGIAKDKDAQKATGRSVAVALVGIAAGALIKHFWPH